MTVRSTRPARRNVLPHSPAGPLWHASTAAALVASGWLVFGLPWLIPVPEKIQSDAAALGFNNTVATLGVAATLLVLFLRRVCVRGVGEVDAERFRSIVVAPARVTVREAVVLVACIAVSWGVVGGWWAILPNAFFGESTYFLTRLDMMTLGHLPYRDFEFGYGPGLLWLPFLLHRACGGLVAIDTAYVLTLLGHYALGLTATAALLRHLAIGPGMRSAILVFVALASLNITLGVIYAPLRFVYALWAILLFDAAQRHSPAWQGWLVAFLLPLGGLLLSPEVGITTLLSCLTWLAAAAWCGRGALFTRAAAVAASVALMWGVAGAGMFRSVGTFGGGALNFPLLPAPYVLALLGVAFAVLPALAAAGIRGRGDTAPILLSLVVATGLLLPAALGRCDPGHVLFNGLGLLQVALAAGVSAMGRRQRAGVALAAVTILATGQWSSVSQYRKGVDGAMELRGVIAGHRAMVEANDALVLQAVRGLAPGFDWSKRSPFTPDLLKLLRFGRIGTPLGTSEDLDRFLKLSGRYHPEYHVPPYSGVVDPGTVDRKVADAAGCDLLLVPRVLFTAEGSVDPRRYGEGISATLSSLFVFPVALTATRMPWTGDLEVLHRLIPDYAPVGRFREMVILERRAPTAAPSPAAAP